VKPWQRFAWRSCRRRCSTNDLTIITHSLWDHITYVSAESKETALSVGRLALSRHSLDFSALPNGRCQIRTTRSGPERDTPTDRPTTPCGLSTCECSGRSDLWWRWSRDRLVDDVYYDRLSRVVPSTEISDGQDEKTRRRDTSTHTLSASPIDGLRSEVWWWCCVHAHCWQYRMGPVLRRDSIASHSSLPPVTSCEVWM